MDAQKIYDTVRDHLLKQGRKSYAPKEGCLYRGPNGLKCAAGILIPNSRYSEQFEHLPAFNSIIVDAMPDWWRSNLRLIERLQGVHDGRKPSAWRRALRAVAKDFDLNPGEAA